MLIQITKVIESGLAIQGQSSQSDIGRVLSLLPEDSFPQRRPEKPTPLPERHSEKRAPGHSQLHVSWRGKKFKKFLIYYECQYQ